jgi:AraC-like DNA-binding protein
MTGVATTGFEASCFCCREGNASPPCRDVTAPSQRGANRPTFVRHPSVPDVEIRIVRHQGARSPPTPPMMTSDLKVALVDNGANRFLYRGSSWLVPRGTLILAEPGEVHAVESVAGAFDVLIFFIDAPAVSELRRGLSFKGPLSRERTCVRAFRALSTALGDTTSTGLLVEERLISFVDAISRAYGSRIPGHARYSFDAAGVSRAREMLHDLYRDPLTLDALAAESGLPKLRFVRAFKRVVGLPPHAYQIHLRVDHARRMLAQGAAIADAAAAAGFFDQSHLHRHFKRLHGVTPSEYRCKNVQEDRARTT